MIKSLTSLRFCFAFMVFMSHNVVPTEHKWVRHLFEEGYAGVSFFFILSGFILMHSYQERLSTGRITVLDFYQGRLARIYPLHLLTLLIAVVFLQRPTGTIGYFIKLLSNLFLFQSFVPDKSFYFSFNAPSWSISDEMFFYLLFPMIILVLHRKNIFGVVLLLCIMSVSIFTLFSIDTDIQHALFYISPFFRIIDFGLGISLYLFCRELEKINKWNVLKRKKGVKSALEIFSVMIFFFFYFLSFFIPQVYRYSFWYWIPMCLVIASFSMSQTGFLSRLLSNKYFVILGEISFGFYLFHQLIGRIFFSTLNKIGISMAYLPSFLILLTMTIVVSYFSFKYYETPCNRKIKQLNLSIVFKRILKNRKEV